MKMWIAVVLMIVSLGAGIGLGAWGMDYYAANQLDLQSKQTDELNAELKKGIANTPKAVQASCGFALDSRDKLIAQMKAAADASRGELEKAQQDSKIVTIFYEPGPPLAIPVYRNLVSLQINGAPIPSNPKWYVPYKVTPEIAGHASGLMYVYFDTATRKLDGPYVPQIIPPQP